MCRLCDLLKGITYTSLVDLRSPMRHLFVWKKKREQNHSIFPQVDSTEIKLSTAMYHDAWARGVPKPWGP